MQGITPDPEVRVLLISPSEPEVTALRRILSHTAWSFDVAGSLAEAMQKLEANPAPVVFCAQRLPDGTWKDALAKTSTLKHRPNLIVVSPQPEDKLWMEVLDSGAYDLIGKPFKADEVFRIISLGWLHWKQQLRHTARRTRDVPGRVPAAVTDHSPQTLHR